MHIGLALNVAGLPERDHEIGNVMTTPEAEGESIEIVGTVTRAGDTAANILVEAWQADAHGRYITDFSFDNAFNSLGRAAPGVDEAGHWIFHIVKPGRVTYPAGAYTAPHVNLMLFARGVNTHLHTRLYFVEEPQANDVCPFMHRVPPGRRHILIARRNGENDADHRLTSSQFDCRATTRPCSLISRFEATVC